MLHNQECARYLETFKSYESKPSLSIQVRMHLKTAGKREGARVSQSGSIDPPSKTALSRHREPAPPIPPTHQEHVATDYMSRLTAALTSSVRAVNRTDVATLAASRGSLASLLRSTPEQLSACPGFGPTKVRSGSRDMQGVVHFRVRLPTTSHLTCLVRRLRCPVQLTT